MVKGTKLFGGVAQWFCPSRKTEEDGKVIIPLTLHSTPTLEGSSVLSEMSIYAWLQW